jgi:hypothetical protein
LGYVEVRRQVGPDSSSATTSPSITVSPRWLQGLIIFPWKVLFEDGSRWNWTFETSQVCFGEFWRDPKHPRLTTLPMEVKDKILKELGADKP